MNYFKNKRELIDICNICLEKKKLSYDHVPPQGGINLTPVEINTISNRMHGHGRATHISQNGVKFRFICIDCNGKLGTKYDVELNKFTKSLAMFLNSTLFFPSLIKIKTQPVKLIKAILGHLLSAKQVIDESKFDNKIRSYLFNDYAELDEDIHIYYWIYPYQETVIVRDFALLYWNSEGKQMGLFQILKYFPIAFIVTDKANYEGHNELTMYKKLALEMEIDLLIRLNEAKANDWPERVDDNTVMFMSAETGNGVYARPKNKMS